MSNILIVLWAASVLSISIAVISVAWARLTTKGCEKLDNHLDRDMLHDYTQLQDDQKDIIRSAVRRMRDD